MQINLKLGKPNAEGVEGITRMEVTGLPYDHIPRIGAYGTNNNVVVFTDRNGKTSFAAREIAERALEHDGFLLVSANVMFSQSPHLLLDELRGHRRHVPEDIRIMEFQRMYGSGDETLWYFPA